MIKEDKIEEVIKEITDDIKNRTDIATLGMSGGADSTLVAILCTLALGKENVYGYGMPFNQLDADTFNSKSESIARKLGVNYSSVSIRLSVQETLKSITTSKKGESLSEVNRGNLRSRMRMVYLYTLNTQIGEIANRRSRVIGTGNKSEDYIGYDTKGGDALADFFPIGRLFKSEVYQLLDYFAGKGIITKDMIERTPSAGLWDGQTDEDELGYTYNEMEHSVRFCEANYDNMDNIILDEITSFVWNRHKVNKHKHEGPEVTQLNKNNFEY